MRKAAHIPKIWLRHDIDCFSGHKRQRTVAFQALLILFENSPVIGPVGAEARWGHTGKEDSTLSRSHQWMMAVQDANERYERETTARGWEERDPSRMGKAGQMGGQHAWRTANQIGARRHLQLRAANKQNPAQLQSGLHIDSHRKLSTGQRKMFY